MTLTFSGDASIQLQVECIEAELKDLGPAWRTRCKPEHPGEAVRRERLLNALAMAAWLKTSDPNFEDRFKALLAQKREQASDVDDAVAAIIARVRAEGDKALIDLTLPMTASTCARRASG